MSVAEGKDTSRALIRVGAAHLVSADTSTRQVADWRPRSACSRPRSCAGLYGTLSYRVGRRTREIAVRMALGAERGQVLRMVLGDSLAVCTAGILVGLPLAIAGSRFLESILLV